MAPEPKTVWWGYVPACRAMVKAAAKDLTDNVTSLQISTSFSPWKEQFDEDLRECIVDKYGYGIDLRDLYGSDLSAYPRLTDGIVQILGIDKGYNGNIASIKNNLPEAGCIIWLHELPAELQTQCVDLCAKLAGISGKAGFPRFRLIFESEDITKHKGIRIVNNNVLTQPNIRYFVYRMLMEANLGKLTEYAVAVVLEVAGNDIYVCGELCTQIMDESFENVVRRLKSDPEYIYAMHRAQIRTIEPLIQIGRLQLCAKYESDILSLLPFDDDYGTTIREPCELELRHLWYYKNELSLSASDSSRLRLLYEARNNLSHQRVLDDNIVCELIEKYQ